MSDFHVTFRRKSRKERRCPECGTTIHKGERYVRHAGCTDGDFFDAIQCVPCNAFAKRYLASLSIASHLNWDEKTYHFGSLIEEAAEHVGFDWDAAKTMPARRDAIMAMFDRFDADQRAYQDREREIRRKARASAERWKLHKAASQLIARGMSQCSAIPTPTPGGLAEGGR